MFLEERTEILSRISEVQGMLKTIKNYLEVYYPDDETINSLFSTADHELDQAKGMSLGIYGTWGPLADVWKLESNNGD